MLIYFIISIVSIIISFFAFMDSIIINEFSLCPAVLIGVSFLQAMIFKSNAFNDDDGLLTNTTAYSIREPRVDIDAYRKNMKYHYICKMVIIPVLLLFVIHFNSILKIVASISMYLLSFMPVKILARIDKK